MILVVLRFVLEPFFAVILVVLRSVLEPFFAVILVVLRFLLLISLPCGRVLRNSYLVLLQLL